MWGSRGGGGGSDLKHHKNAGLLSNSGPDPLKNYEATKQHSMLGHHQHASETPWSLAGGPMMARL